jgi:glutathione S-transferase
MIKLFYAPHTCSLASHIALEDAGAEYSSERISFAANEQHKPEYLAINPKGRMPALVTDKGILTETPADPRLYRAEPSPGAPGTAR